MKIAPALKDFYRRIENDPSLKGKIKLIGIGAGNSLDEVQQFKNATEAPFPLFPDKDFTVHKALGEVNTPYFIVIKINNDGTHKVVYSEKGGFNDAQTFLDLILADAGMK